MSKKRTTSAATEIIYQTATTIIVSVSAAEIGKIVLPSPYVFVNAKTKEPVDFLDSKKPDLYTEMGMLAYANTVNNLMPKFLGLQEWHYAEKDQTHQMIVMERLEALPIHYFDISTRQKMFQNFEKKMKQLHDSLFVHGDFARPTNYLIRGNKEWIFQNIVQTPDGLRLLDAGFSQIYKEENSREFFHILLRERDEVKEFKNYYLKEG